MTIEKRRDHAGVDVHLDPEECELFMELASDVETINQEIVTCALSRLVLRGGDLQVSRQ